MGEDDWATDPAEETGESPFKVKTFEDFKIWAYQVFQPVGDREHEH